jgi:hypothetical protein
MINKGNYLRIYPPEDSIVSIVLIIKERRKIQVDYENGQQFCLRYGHQKGQTRR